jgi:hypothetical protein
LQDTQALKVQFKVGKNPVDQTLNFKLKNFNNQVQTDRGLSWSGLLITISGSN